MTTKKKTPTTAPRGSGTRDAVESAIELTKADSNSVWESPSRHTRIARWKFVQKPTGGGGRKDVA